MKPTRYLSRILPAACCLLLATGGCGKKNQSEQKEKPATTGPAPTEKPPVAKPPPAPSPGAKAAMKSSDGKSIGDISFTEKDGKVEISGELHGLTPGEHGFHIHEGKECVAPGFETAGGHFAPNGKPHGAPTAAEHHAGDFGNLEAGADGTAKIQLSSDAISLTPGAPDSVLGRAVILHANADDLHSQPSGKAGPRFACGVIEATPAAPVKPTGTAAP